MTGLEAEGPAPVPAGDAEPMDPETAARWARVRRLAHVMDTAFVLPGTDRRFGVDGIIGLVPGVGDAAGLVVAAVVVGEGVRLGARGWVLARMLLTVALDAIVGLVPVAGWAFDFAFKASQRNVRLLEQHVTAPETTRAESRRAVLLSLVTVVAVTVVVVVALVALVGWVWSWLT